MGLRIWISVTRRPRQRSRSAWRCLWTGLKQRSQMPRLRRGSATHEEGCGLVQDQEGWQGRLVRSNKLQLCYKCEGTHVPHIQKTSQNGKPDWAGAKRFRKS